MSKKKKLASSLNSCNQLKPDAILKFARMIIGNEYLMHILLTGNKSKAFSRAMYSTNVTQV